MKARMKRIAALLVAGFAPSVFALDSGSTGALGAFNPTVSTEVLLPPNGVLNYTTINIPSGVTVTFRRNAANTPVYMLASGNVTIAGTIDLSGGMAPAVGVAGDGNLFDDGNPGRGGPGGYDGGQGGRPAPDFAGRLGSNGLGPGGGVSPNISQTPQGIVTGGGAGFGEDGGRGLNPGTFLTPGGVAYGNDLLQPLIGGSGGGGAAGSPFLAGGGGGGGGGAILIASSGLLQLEPSGVIASIGGIGGETHAALQDYRQGGGHGSGGAVRIVATQIAARGFITTRGAVAIPGDSSFGGNGSGGRVRIEAEIIGELPSVEARTYTTGTPGPLFAGGTPALRISRIGGLAVPLLPGGSNDVTLPATLPDPVSIEVTGNGIPLGTAVVVRVTPRFGPQATATTPGLAGPFDNSTASASLSIPSGSNVVSASATFVIAGDLREAMSRYAGGQPVDRIRLESTLGQATKAFAVTRAGWEVELPHEALPVLAAMRP